MDIAFLTTTRLLDEIGCFTYIDEDTGQLDRYDTKPSVPPNSVLISINVLSTQDISDTRQIVKAAIVLRYWYDVVRSETSNKAPEAAVARSLAYNDNIKAIFKKLQGYSDDELDTFSRQSDIKENRPDGLTVRRMTYITSYYEFSDNEQ